MDKILLVLVTLLMVLPLIYVLYLLISALMMGQLYYE